MAILISDDILRAENLDEDALRIELATILYDRELLSLGLAARMARLDRMQFQREMAARNIDLKYSPDDLEQDLDTLSKLNLYGRHK